MPPAQFPGYPGAPMPGAPMPGYAGYPGYAAPAAGAAQLRPLALISLALGAVGVVGLFLPLLTFSYRSISQSASMWDGVTANGSKWMNYGYYDCLVFGAGAALVLALLVVVAKLPSIIATLGFAALATGAIWFLIEANNNGVFKSGSGYSVGFGLWMMLGAGVGGAVLSLLDFATKSKRAYPA